MKKIQSLIGVLCVLTLCICMSGCNQTEKNEDKIGVGNPEEELAVSPYTSGETDEGITNLSDINMSLKKLDKDKKELIILLENTGEKTYRYMVRQSGCRGQIRCQREEETIRNQKRVCR